MYFFFFVKWGLLFKEYNTLKEWIFLSKENVKIVIFYFT